MIILSIFAERLNDLMLDDNQISTETLAAKVGVDSTAIRKYLRGLRIPSVRVLVNLADYFNCTTDFLLGLEQENYKRQFKKCPPFNERLAFLLKSKGKKKTQLQKQTNIPESAIYNWLRGDYEPSVENLDKIAEFFDCSIDYLLGRVDYE